MGQKTEGNMDDAIRVVGNLKNGMVWEIACRTGEFMPVDMPWYDKNRALFHQWVIDGIPPPPGLTEALNVKPSPINTAVTPDGKVWALYRDAKGGIYREEVKQGAEVLPPPVVVEEKLMAPTTEAPPKKGKQW